MQFDAALHHISVIIPTYNRPGPLIRTLYSLQEQTLSSFELLVVDNAADSKIKHMIAEFNLTARIKAHYIAHSCGGNSGARNRGVQEATGELLVYTDDDLTFDVEWLKAYDRAFADYPEMVASGGCVKPAWEEPPPKWLLEYIGDRSTFAILALMEPADHFTLSNEGFFASCNMAVRRSVFEWTGFHPEMFGAQTIGDGETGLQRDIAKQGGLIGCVPDAIAYHHILPSRMTVDYIRKWAWHRGGARMYARWHGKERTLTSLAKELIVIIRQYWRQWAQDFAVRHRRDPRAIDIQFRASLGWCKLNYVWWMITDPRVQTVLDMADFRPEHGVTMCLDS